MLIQNRYNRQSLRSLQGEWKDLALLFQQLCTIERRQMPDGAIMERVKQDSLSIETFLNCVATIVNRIDNEFGALEVDDIYKQLDPTNIHQNSAPLEKKEYEYCCNKIYERSVIFGGVYFIISIEHPDLADVLTAVYSKVDYKEGRPYLFHFVNAIKKRKQFSNEEIDEQIPPHMIPEVLAFNEAYRHMNPNKRIRQFEMIMSIIDNMPIEEKNSQILLLRIVTGYALLLLRRMYGGLDDRKDIPEVDKLTISEIINIYQAHFSKQKESILPFIERLLEEKLPSAKDTYYRKMLEDDSPKQGGNINVTIQVNGDYVNGDKHVGAQIDNVESGGAGVQNFKQ